METEYYLQPPVNQLFYRYMANLMSFFSVGDRAAWGYKKVTTVQVINSTIMYIFGPVCVASQIVYFYFNYSELNFDILGIMFSIFPATCLANVNIYSSRFKSYKHLSLNFLQKIHLYNIYKESKDEFVKKKLVAMERITRWTSYYLFFFFITNWLGWMIITAVNNYNNRELVFNCTVRLQTCLFIWMPFDYSYDYRSWFVLHLINCYTVLAGVSSMMIFQSVNYMIVYNLIGHIHVLKNSLRTNFTDDLSDQEVRKKLSKIVEYHTFINKVFKEAEDAFGFNVAANYLQNLFGNSVVLYQLMYGGRENMMLYVTMIMAYTGGPILMSFVLEEIRRQTHDLPDVVYSIPWEKMSVPNQKTVMLILQRSQILMDFKALGGFKAGVGPMISILKTTFSYYVMLETTMS
ncbi:uncharacterized protein LOC126771314 [Nymphalis io]|uniref:uncharacterized protein LOC126771314 n=1 Tax=Inachis io TaxID=171585 RepID=UPI002169B18B|nr:uncharacterized protein LOC126771314 [Nymphalis io]